MLKVLYSLSCTYAFFWWDGSKTYIHDIHLRLTLGYGGKYNFDPVILDLHQT